MRQDAKEIGIKWLANELVAADLKNEELINCLFEPVAAYTSECGQRWRYYDPEEYDRQLDKEFYTFRFICAEELKRRLK